jgi:SET domain-containing protein
LLLFLTPALSGWGLRLEQDVKAGDLVIEYVGEVIDSATCRKRLLEQEKAGTPSFYILSLNADTFLDARHKANLARFINHSCDPNCMTQVCDCGLILVESSFR